VPDCALLHSLRLDRYTSPIPPIPALRIRTSRVLTSRIPTAIGITVIGGSTATDTGTTTADTGLISTAGTFLLITIERSREGERDEENENPYSISTIVPIGV
jgi:hypothetical protein